MFIGEYHYNMDNKGRLTVPTKIREKLGENFIITRGLDKCVFLYTIDEWEEMTVKLKKLPLNNTDARAFTRFFLSAASENTLDSQSRTKITSPLIEYAGLTKECVLVGVNNRVEIWDKVNWLEYVSSTNETLAEVAENLSFDF